MIMRINSIYLATEGEGVWIGTVQIFVRFNGCGIGCDNCDSSYTWSFNGGLEMSLLEVLAEIDKVGHNGLIRRVSITGGDPLNCKNIDAALALAQSLKEKNYYLNIEASGDRVAHDLFTLADFISIDYKTPSSGVTTPLNVLTQMIDQFSGKFQVKSVIENIQDFNYVKNAYAEIKKDQGGSHFAWVLTPSYNTNETFPKERFKNILNWNESHGGFFRVVGQQHKWVYGPKKTNV